MIDVIVFCFDDRWQDWQKLGFPARSSIIAKSFAEHSEVGRMLIVGAPTSFPKGAYRYLLKPGEIGGRVLHRHKDQFYLTEQIDNVFTVEQLRFFPRESSNPLFYRLNCLAHDNGLVDFVKSKIGQLNMGNIVLWLNNPLAARFIGRFNEALTVYNAVDDWPLHPQLAPMRGSLEDGIATIKERADAVFAVSKRLTDKLNGNRAKALMVPNGVDLRDYDKHNVYEPGDLTGIRHPRVGYVGVMQERFDIDLFEKVVIRTPEISYILVGPLFSPAHFNPLKKYENVHFLGRKNKRDVPAYLYGFDVCVMPHTISDFTVAMNPIKLYEYLAAGKPVISTPIPGLDLFQGFVEFADDAAGFERKIKMALSTNQASQNTARIAFAQENSWSQRVEEMLKVINDLRR